jgi:hypothetical protein
MFGHRFIRMKCLYPIPNVVTGRRYGDTSESCRIKLQSTQGSVQQPTGSYGIVAPEVLERGGYLNQPLQERLIRLMCSQPHRFPSFIRSEVPA